MDGMKLIIVIPAHTMWKDRVVGVSSFNVGKVLSNYLYWYFWAVFTKKDLEASRK